MFYCSFVSIHYIICECGETFPTEEELKGHLERDHAHKKEKKEYKCGVVSCINVFFYVYGDMVVIMVFVTLVIGFRNPWYFVSTSMILSAHTKLNV